MPLSMTERIFAVVFLIAHGTKAGLLITFSDVVTRTCRTPSMSYHDLPFLIVASLYCGSSSIILAPVY